MKTESMNRTPRIVFGIACIAVAALELALCFRGPIAFDRKPSLVLFPIFSYGISDEEIEEVTGYLERELALTNSYAIVSRKFIEEYYIRTDPDRRRHTLDTVTFSEAHRISRELELERFAIATLWGDAAYVTLTVAIRSVRDGEVIRSERFVTGGIPDLLAGKDGGGDPLRIRELLSVETKGIGFTDYLVLGLLMLQVMIGTAALMGKVPSALVEIVITSSLVLFLFAYIHALSANMDYVQRYIATNGGLRLAQSTAKEQLFAVLRFGPLLIVNSAFHLIRMVREGRDVRFGDIPRRIVPFSLPMVFVSAFMFSMSFPSFVSLRGLAPLAWVSLVPLFLVLIASKPPMAIFYGVSFGTIQALLVNYWHGTYNYVTLHMVTIAFLAEFLVFMLPLVAIIRVSGRWGFLTVPAAWTVFDYLRSIGILGYPWGLIGTSQYPFIPFIQIASITGVWGLGFVVLLCNASIAWAAVYKGFSLRLGIGREAVIPVPLAVFTAVFGAALIAGSLILRDTDRRLETAEREVTVVLVQQNTDPRKREYRENTLTLMEITDEAIASLPGAPDLVVWPEGGFMLDITYWSAEENRRTYWGGVVDEFREYQRDLGTWLVTGTQDHIDETVDGETVRRNFNSSVLIDDVGNIRNFYHKINLVPFSEHFPLDKERYSGLYELFQKFDISNWTVGDVRHVYEHEAFRFCTPICFEDVFSDHLRRFVLQELDVIINMSNDYWSLSPVEGVQHGILALFRAVENRRPLLRATCSGYTLYADAAGRIQPGSPEPYTAGYMVARIPLPERRLSLYTRWGDWFPAVCGIAVALCMAGWAVSRVIGVLRIRRTVPRRDSASPDRHPRGTDPLRRTSGVRACPRDR